ncbi:hypothetical protein CRM22_004018 [Opisthorchis felineus]|uniref:Phorbol-ester/DAG-type domain-containing protein n=1 Tax=Opisthorchis felineus TaxID=147828 RepID=A0A4S2M4J2_OPIFE|nr:hypothetical protein CRM22_004018 [Opisthorchis felineus]
MSHNASPYSLERTNPFDQEQDVVDAQCSDICALYNASVAATSETPTLQNFADPVQEDFFDEPLINVDSTSAVAELEDAILRCKHMVLATSNEDEAKRQRLLDRLIELRCILHNIKEDATRIPSDSPTSPNFINGPSEPLIYDRGSSESLPAASSKLSLTTPGVQSPRNHRDSRCITGPGGHQFRLILPLRYLGTICEHCLDTIRNPSKRVLACTACHIVCHSQLCLRGLTRHCPAVVDRSVEWRFSPTPMSSRQHRRRTLSRPFRVDPVSTIRRTRSVCEPDASESHLWENTANSSQFRCLEVSRLTYVGASLSAQCWACFECQQPLCPAPNRTVTPERSVMTSLVQRAGSVFESGIGLLTKQATETGSEKPTSHSHSPQICSQDPTLSNFSVHLLGPKTVNITSDPSSTTCLSWAYSSSLHDLGPLQTWEDARVHEAVNRFSRMSNSVRQPRVVGGEVRMNQTTTVRVKQQAEAVLRPSNATEFDAARLCYYTGKFYCSRCHWGDSHLIPACIFVLGDNRPKPVCRSSLLWLTYSWSRHLFRVPDAWYRYEPHARKVCSLRLRAFRLRPYLDICDAMRELQRTSGLLNPSWLLEQPYTFNMAVVIQVLDGTIIDRLQKFLSLVDDHVQSCDICSSRVSDRCGVCNDGPVRPYQLKSAFCYKCRRVCHRYCLLKPLPVSMEHVTDQSESDKDDWVEITYPVVRAVCRKCG